MNPELPNALWHLSPTESILREVSRPNGNEIQVDALHSLISLGTERMVASGQIPDSLYEEMKVPYQEGDLGLPVKYGYSLVGQVNQPGHTWHEQIVHLLHPHQSRIWISEEDLFLVPAGIPARRASLASNLETAVNAVWDSGISVGDRVLIVGYGLIGALIAELAKRIPATQVYVAELRDDRQAVAKEAGLQSWNPGWEACDLAFHTSASEAGLQLAIDSVGLESKVVEMSWYGNREVRANLGGTFHSQRKSIQASQVSGIPPSKAPRWDYRRRKEVVFDLLQDSQFDRYLTHEVMFDKLPQFFQKLRATPVDGIGWSVNYESRE